MKYLYFLGVAAAAVDFSDSARAAISRIRFASSTIGETLQVLGDFAIRTFTGHDEFLPSECAPVAPLDMDMAQHGAQGAHLGGVAQPSKP